MLPEFFLSHLFLIFNLCRCLIKTCCFPSRFLPFDSPRFVNEKSTFLPIHKNKRPKHNNYQLRTKHVDIIGWNLQTANVGLLPAHEVRGWFFKSRRVTGSWTTVRNCDQSKGPKRLTHSPHFPTASSHSYLAMKKPSEVGLLCMIPHADYFCRPEFITSFFLAGFFFPLAGLHIGLCVLAEAFFNHVIFFTFSMWALERDGARECLHIRTRVQTCVQPSRTGKVNRTWFTLPQQKKTKKKPGIGYIPKQFLLTSWIACIWSCQSGLATTAGFRCETQCWIQRWFRPSREPHHLSSTR